MKRLELDLISVGKVMTQIKSEKEGALSQIQSLKDELQEKR
jgi:hypothetical protein